jgi:hypothetical protein
MSAVCRSDPIIEVLRLTGIRCEELLELSCTYHSREFGTHMSIVPADEATAPDP